MRRILIWGFFVTCLLTLSCQGDEDGMKLNSKYGKFGLVITNRYAWQERNLRIYESLYNRDFDSNGGSFSITGRKHENVNLEIICEKVDSLIPIGNLYYNGLVPIDANYRIMIVGEILRNGKHNDTLIIDDIKITKDGCFVKQIELNPL